MRRDVYAAALVLAATACDAKPPQPPFAASGLFVARAGAWVVAQRWEASVMGGCELVETSTELAECVHVDGSYVDPILGPELADAVAPPPPPATGAFCAFTGRAACCHEANERDLSVLLSNRRIETLVVGLRFFSEGDVLAPLIEHPSLPRGLRELTVVVQGDMDGVHPVDLSALVELRALKKLTAAGIGTVRGVERIVEHPSLEEFDVGWLALRDEDEALLRAQRRIVVRWDAARAQAAHDGPVCPSTPHQMVREATEREPADHHYHCSWPFPP
ncbi:MAG: hypothetical protein RIF41_28375 [Polyangiaceae bacterium]